jgi:hypothetical protein
MWGNIFMVFFLDCIWGTLFRMNEWKLWSFNLVENEKPIHLDDATTTLKCQSVFHNWN